jgi:hypothetical protein
MTNKQTDWIASRKLTDQTTGETVVVLLGRPEMVSGVSAEEWRCGFLIEGATPEPIRYAHGLDAFQSLSLAIEGIQVALANSNRQLTWEGGEPGDTGFRRSVPLAFGLSFAREIDSLIDEKIQDFADVASERAKQKNPGAG